MKKNNKGFTIVEIMMVLVLISILFAIAIPSALKFSARNKEKVKISRIKLIEKGAVIYGEDNKSLITNSCEKVTNGVANASCYKVTLDELYENNYITKDDLIDPTKGSDNNKLKGYVEIQYYYNKYYAVFVETSS